MSSITLHPTTGNTAAPRALATTPPSGTTDSSSSQTSLSSLGTTFMQLLVQELQNQDPTAPMDSTQMVGQMISLNQLDQVASINQLLTSKLGGTTSTADPTAGAKAAVAAQAANNRQHNSITSAAASLLPTL